MAKINPELPGGGVQPDLCYTHIVLFFPKKGAVCDNAAESDGFCLFFFFFPLFSSPPVIPGSDISPGMNGSEGDKELPLCADEFGEHVGGCRAAHPSLSLPPPPSFPGAFLRKKNGNSERTGGLGEGIMRPQ